MAKFGEHVTGYTIPVLNEREIRASAGILFVFMFMALMLIIFKGDFVMIKYVVILFLTDLITRVFVSPRYSPILIIGRLIVGRQNPEYVGAAQKKFAWIIGIAIATMMFFLLVVLNSYSIFAGLSCLVCLTFLFFESAFGICLGCVVYKWVNKEKAQYCPGEICDAKAKQEIQEISWSQIVIVVSFITAIILMSYLLNETFAEKPRDLWNLLNVK
jgi:hypothetical protein